jgi:hypothetical protein
VQPVIEWTESIDQCLRDQLGDIRRQTLLGRNAIDYFSQSRAMPGRSARVIHHLNEPGEYPTPDRTQSWPTSVMELRVRDPESVN